MQTLVIAVALLASVSALQLQERAVEPSLTEDEEEAVGRIKRQINFGFQGGFPQHHGHGRFPQHHGGGFQGGFPQNQGHFHGNNNHGGGHHQPHQGFPVTTPQTFIRGPFGYVPANQAPGNNNPNCRGNRKRLPECQGGNLGFQDFNQGGGPAKGPPNCQGKRKNRPECNVNTAPLLDPHVINAFQSIAWLSQLAPDNKTVGIPNLPDTPSAQSQSRNFLLGVDQADKPFQTCRTPRFQPGHCRYLQHCILQDFIHSFSAFLQYVCFIEGTYVGVCCPDSRYPGSTTTTTSSTTTTTTPRPTTQPSTRGCGVSAKQQTRIVGGQAADPQEWPWMAALLRNGQTQYCGGVLISDTHVLTAAHCVNGFTVDQITVRLGEYTFDNPDNSAHHDYKPLQIRQHLNYNTTTFVNDIAILVLPQAAVFNVDIWPVCLPEPDLLFTNEIATVTGWGTIYYGGPVATTLQEVTIPVWTNSDCDDSYEQPIVDTVLCAGDKQGGKDSCQGDSGGPLLLQQGAVKRWTVIGVVSWGIRCAEPGFPGVYTRVNRYLDWIQQNAV